MFSVVTTLVVTAFVAIGVPGQPVAELPAATVCPASPDGTPQQSPGPEEPVDLNAATAEELQEVPGIGPTLAGRIVAFREENGPFEKVDDLLNVQGIGTRSLERIRPHVTVKKPKGSGSVAARGA